LVGSILHRAARLCCRRRFMVKQSGIFQLCSANDTTTNSLYGLNSPFFAAISFKLVSPSSYYHFISQAL